MDEGRSHSFALLFATVVIQECLSRNRDYCPCRACLYVSYVSGMKPDTAKQTFSISPIFKAEAEERRGEKKGRKTRKGDKERRQGKENRERAVKEKPGKGRSGCALVDL